MVDMVLKFDGKDCNYVIRWSQILSGVATNRTRQRVQVRTWEIPVTYKNYFFFSFSPLYHKGGQILEQVAQGSYRIFIPGNTQNAAG